MNGDSKVASTILAALAVIVLIAYLFFGLEDDMNEPTAPPPELLKDSKKLLGEEASEGAEY